ncbi:hypothetical protein WN944_009811 [Citrus x changshan-huyou]|uniref:Uncharacterized protein n=1 Tax=Citrus x changshan-huyou TaxID=2935761 RepID=A0AAP0MQG9_9ROSI
MIIQVWAYEAVSVIGDKCAKRYGDLFPRILRWKSTKPKEFEEIQMNVLNKKASRMVFIEKLHATGDVEANKHYMSYFSEDEWLEEIGEENDNAIESDSHAKQNPSHEDNESHDSELNSFDGFPDASDSDGAPTSSGPRTLPPEHLNKSASIPAEVTKKKISHCSIKLCCNLCHKLFTYLCISVMKGVSNKILRY